MTDPRLQQFRALTCSSPSRWQTLRLVVRWHGQHPSWPEPVRAWVRRPDGLRVETLGGQLVRAERESGGDSSTALLTRDGRGLPPPPQLPDVRPDDPMFQDYRWVAMLDPAELATCDVRDLREVDHYGRPAWEAVLRPTDDYDPRCPCCPLLHSRQSDQLDAEASGLPTHELDFQYAAAHRVRLDAETGVCVLTEEIGGSHAGSGHEALIEAVDEPMPDELFSARRRRLVPWARR